MSLKKIVRGLLLISVLSFLLTLLPDINTLTPELEKIFDSQWDQKMEGLSPYSVIGLYLLIILSYTTSIILSWRIKLSGIYFMLFFYFLVFYISANVASISTNTVLILETISDISFASAATFIYLINNRDKFL